MATRRIDFEDPQVNRGGYHGERRCRESYLYGDGKRNIGVSSWIFLVNREECGNCGFLPDT
jgi:hypothetical protein